jgi:hypothetical protein
MLYTCYNVTLIYSTIYLCSNVRDLFDLQTIETRGNSSSRPALSNDRFVRVGSLGRRAMAAAPPTRRRHPRPPRATGVSSTCLRTERARRWPGRENGIVFGVLSLCLSRACLGKMFVFIYEWRKNAVFRRLPDFGSGYLKDLGCSNTDTSLQCPAGVLPPEMNPADIGAKNALVWSHFHQH